MQSVAITGEKYQVDETARKYVLKKLMRLTRLLPRGARNMASAEVKLRQIDQSHGNKYEVEVLLHMPDKTLVAKDSTLNILAAVDIVEAKLVTQLHKYKQLATVHKSRRNIFGRLRRGLTDNR